MNYKPLNLLFIFILSIINMVFSQISITEIKAEKVELSVGKPKDFDSTKNFQSFEKFYDYKSYIGQEVFIPDRYYEKEYDVSKSFLFTSKPSLYAWNNKLVVSYVYKPIIRIDPMGKWEGILQITNSNAAMNQYYRITDVLYGSKLDSLRNYLYNYYNTNGLQYINNSNMKRGDRGWIPEIFEKEKNDSLQALLNRNYSPNSNLYSFNDSMTLYFDNFDLLHYEFEGKGMIFELENKLSKEKVYYLPNNDNYSMDLRVPEYYSRYIKHNLILVPYFQYLKNNLEGLDLIYDDKKDQYGYTINKPFQVTDKRIEEKIENSYGRIETRKKIISVSPGSEWKCTNVTLLKENDYQITFILTNLNGDQIDLLGLNGFISKNAYLHRKQNESIEKKQLEEQKKQDEIKLKEEQKIKNEKFTEICISKFGSEYGYIVSQRKVQIGMTMEMCEMAWGKPLWNSKTTTENMVVNHWYYTYGYSLHFKNNKLYRIEQ